MMSVLPLISLFLGIVAWILVLWSQAVSRQLRANPTPELINKCQRIIYAMYVLMFFLVVALGFFLYGLVQSIRAL